MLRLEVEVTIGVRAQVVVPVPAHATGGLSPRVFEEQLGSNTCMEIWSLLDLSSAGSTDGVDASKVHEVRG